MLVATESAGGERKSFAATVSLNVATQPSRHLERFTAKQPGIRANNAGPCGRQRLRDHSLEVNQECGECPYYVSHCCDDIVPRPPDRIRHPSKLLPLSIGELLLPPVKGVLAAVVTEELRNGPE